MNNKQQKWFHSILLSIREAAIVVDKHGKVNLLNSVAKMLTGWKLEGRPSTWSRRRCPDEP